MARTTKGQPGLPTGTAPAETAEEVAPLRAPAVGSVEVARGLKGVVVADTELGDVRGLEGFYHYREYSAVELAEKRTIEDVWHLMFEGHLPDGAEQHAFADEIRPLRHLPASVADILPVLAAGPSFSPLNALRTAVSHLAASAGFRPSLDIDRG